ncbi:MAG: hypothetical protein ACRCX7_12620 [Cetobacterium sp.]|uniref:hypothetical protein n=1 Tax=Cetobacterium sp. TaxID=2071632 RepID=UPI003F31D25A
MTTQEFRDKQRVELDNFAQLKLLEVKMLMNSRSLAPSALAERMGWTRSMVSRVFANPSDYLNKLGEIEEAIR